MPNISIARLKKLEQAETDLEELRITKMLRPFVGAFTENLGILAATKPMSQWPNEFVLAFEAVARTMQTPAQFYKARLPK